MGSVSNTTLQKPGILVYNKQEFVVPKAKTDDDLDKIIEMILDHRNKEYSISPSQTMKDIANTFINNIEITGYIERKLRKNSLDRV